MSAPPNADALRALAASPPEDAAERKALHDAARALMLATEALSDTETRVISSFMLLPLLKVAVDLDLFSIIASRAEPWHVDELATKTGAEAPLLHRVLRFLTTQALIAESDVATYTASRLTPHVQPSGFAAGVRHNSRWTAPSLVAFPGWLKKNAYRVPAGAKDCAFQDALQTEMSAFEFLGADPVAARDTFEFMAWQKVRAKDWMDGTVEAAEGIRLSDRELKDGRTLLVDVGGGSGHQCFAFREKLPYRPGRLVVQDTDTMVAMVDREAAAKADLEFMAYDFFTPQPVKGAKAYYMRTVLHDWDDENCVKILTRLAEACAGDSMVVIDEIVLPAKGASEKEVLYDMVMLTAVGALERSEEQWRVLFQASGLRLKEVSIYDESMSSGLLIAVKA